VEQEERVNVFHREQAGDTAATRTKALEIADEYRAVVDATGSQILIWNLHPNSVVELQVSFPSVSCFSSQASLFFSS